VAGLLPALLLASCARRVPVDETRFLNFDAESSAGALLTGWSGFERTDAGDTFSWAQSRLAVVRVETRRDGDRLLRFRAWAFRYPQAPEQTVTLFVNGNRLETFTLDEKPRVFSAVAPAAAFHPGINELALEFAYAEAPRDRLPGSGDVRTLAAAFDWLEVLPPPAG
jgi:hypothetical protein